MSDSLAGTRVPAPPSEASLPELERAVLERPEDGRAWYELGAALSRAGRPDDAIVALDRALVLVPYQPDACCERALALIALGCLDDADRELKGVLAQAPLHGSALFTLGNLRYRQSRPSEAAALWSQAAHVIDDPVDALENLAMACQRLRRPDRERAAWRDLLVHRPDHPSAAHHLAALGDTEVPPRATDAYLKHLFDAFAPEFDEVLHAIGYRGPELLDELLEATLGSPSGELDVLDAACGTGLCGVRLRRWARRLDGVDLSPAMLSRARKRGPYDRLECAELTAYLIAHPETWELIAAGDALNYFGELGALLRAACGALRPGGSLAFSLERAHGDREAPPGYRLEGHGRYSHTESYVRACVARAGLELVRLDRVVLRYEMGEPVDAWLALARCG